MKTNNRETLNTKVERFNKEQKKIKGNASKSNHQSIFIDFYFKNYKTTN